jgi:phosphate-selective porin OprO/OprP
LIHVGVNYTGVINPADAGASAATRYPVQLRDRPELRVDGIRRANPRTGGGGP